MQTLSKKGIEKTPRELRISYEGKIIFYQIEYMLNKIKITAAHI